LERIKKICSFAAAKRNRDTKRVARSSEKVKKDLEDNNKDFIFATSKIGKTVSEKSSKKR
jgi:uncharacterized protein YegL